MTAPSSFLLEPVRYCRGWPASLPSRPHRPELGTATLPGRAGWRGLDEPYGRQPTLDASASPKELRWIPNYAAAQLEVKLFLRPAALEPERSPRRRGVAAHESVGDVGLTALDRIDDRVVLAMAGQQDGIDFVERDSVRRDNIRSNERHRIDAVDKVRQQRVPSTADDQAVEAAVHRRVRLLVGQFDVTFGKDRVPFHEDLAERGYGYMAIGARSELTRGITFEQAAHFGRAIAVLDGEVADRVPALARGLEQSLARERGQSAPHGSPGYAQSLGDCGLGNARTGRQHALDDQFPDALSYRAVHSPPSLDRIKNSLAGGSIA